MNKKTIIFSIKSALPVMTGYLVLSIGFGLLLQDKGYGWCWAILMSTGIYAGSMQFVTINLLSYYNCYYDSYGQYKTSLLWDYYVRRI